jgi:hypothetical protein
MEKKSMKRVIPWTLASRLVVSALFLVPTPAAATDFYIAVGGAPQIVRGAAGLEHVIAPLVGVNENPDQAKKYWVEVTLQVTGTNRFHCNVKAVKEARYNPGQRMPTRLVVSYPTPENRKASTPQDSYRVKATITRITPAVEGDSPGNNQHQETHRLPKGGKAKCMTD